MPTQNGEEVRVDLDGQPDIVPFSTLSYLLRGPTQTRQQYSLFD